MAIVTDTTRLCVLFVEFMISAVGVRNVRRPLSVIVVTKSIIFVMSWDFEDGVFVDVRVWVMMEGGSVGGIMGVHIGGVMNGRVVVVLFLRCVLVEDGLESEFVSSISIVSGSGANSDHSGCNN